MQTETFSPIPESQMAQHLDNYRTRMIAYAIRNYRINPENAEDLFGEVCYKALVYRHKYDPSKGAISSFLYRVMRNAFIDTVRTDKARFQNAIVFNTFTHEDKSEGFVEFLYEPRCEPVETYDYEMLQSALDLLPNEYSIITKARVKGLTESEIAEALSMPLGTVKTLMSRSRGVLANSLCAVGLIGKENLGKYGYMFENSRNQSLVEQHTVCLMNYRVVKTNIPQRRRNG